MKKIIIVLFIVYSTISSATNYYVSNEGNDNANGLSESTAWKTISKVNGKTFLPDDRILFKKGNVWRETLTLPSSGTSGHHIVFTSYGTGARPKIYGSKKAIAWSDMGGNVWKSATSVSDPNSGTYKGGIYFEGLDGSIKWGHVKKANTASLAAEYDWTWLSNYIYVYAPTDPDSRYNAIEVSQNDIGIYLKNKQYITIDGLDIMYWRLAGIKGGYPAVYVVGLIIKNCEVGFIGTKGSLAAFGLSIYHSNCLVQNNVIHDCGRRSVSINVDNASPAVVRNVTIENNYFYNGFHTTGVDIGNTGNNTFRNFIIRNNIFYDNPTWVVDEVEVYISNMIWASRRQGTVDSLYIYNNVFSYTNTKCIAINGVNSCFINNNTFYGNNSTSKSTGGMIFIDGSATVNYIKNNIFHGTADHNVNPAFPCIYIQAGSTVLSLDYNLYWQKDPLQLMVNISGGKRISDWNSYRSSTGFDAHSPFPSNPLFVSPPDNYHLLSNSPAINAGVNIPGYTYDFDGNPLNSPPDIGCFVASEISVNPVYVSSAVENTIPTRLEMTYNMTLANIIPAASAFTVNVNSVVRSVTTVTISGTKVLLTLGSPIACGDVVTVAYTKPSANPLQTTSGGQAATITARTVTNRVNPISPSYVSSVVENATRSKLEMTYNMTLANIVPAVSAFTVNINSAARSVSTVTISGTKVLLTLGSPIVYSDIVTVAYTKPATNPLQTISGGQAATISNQPVTNNCLNTSIPQNQLPIINIVSPQENSLYTTPATLVLEAVAYDPDGSIMKIELFNCGRKLGEKTSQPYSFVWNNVPIGSYTLTAVAYDNSNATGISNTVHCRVIDPNTSLKAKIEIVEPSDGKKFIIPSTINITTESYDPDNLISKVEYFAGSSKIGESYTAPYSISFESTESGIIEIEAVASDKTNVIVSSAIVSVDIISFDEATGLSNEPNSVLELLNIYPNPNDGRFTIELNKSFQNETISINIINTIGETVYTENLPVAESNLQLDLSYLKSGLYFIRISSDEINVTKKFIIK